MLLFSKVKGPLEHLTIYNCISQKGNHSHMSLFNTTNDNGNNESSRDCQLIIMALCISILLFF